MQENFQPTSSNVIDQVLIHVIIENIFIDFKQLTRKELLTNKDLNNFFFLI